MTASFRVDLATLGGTAAGNLNIGGLPFAAKSTPVGHFFSGALSTTNGLTHGAFTQFGLRISYATQVLHIVEFGVVSGSSTSPLVAVTAISGTGILIGSITYEID